MDTNPIHKHTKCYKVVNSMFTPSLNSEVVTQLTLNKVTLSYFSS